MFDWVRRQAILRALKRSQGKRSPAQFAYSNAVNYYSPHLIHLADGTELLVDKLIPGAIVGRVWNGEKFDRESSVKNSELNDWDLKVHRFYGFDHLIYEGCMTFFINEYSFLVERRYLRNVISQKFYNHRTRFLEDQISVLKGIIDLHLKTAPEGKGLRHVPEPYGITDLFSELYGQRIFGHPRYSEESAKFRLVVEALAANGDLVRTEGSRFKLNPAALNSINRFENDERRHRDSKRLSKVMIILTAVLAFSPLLSSYSSSDRAAHSSEVENHDQ